MVEELIGAPFQHEEGRDEGGDVETDTVVVDHRDLMMVMMMDPRE